MIFTLDEEQNALRDSVRRYCREHHAFAEQYRVRARSEGFCAEAWRRFAEFGWLGAALPEAVGGLGGSTIETALIMEEFGRSLVVSPFFSCAVLAAQTLVASQAGMSGRLLAPVIGGTSLLALAHFERRSRGHLEFLETRAHPASDGYLLNGEKCAVLHADRADRFIVSARTRGSPRDVDGVKLFLINGDARGLARRDYRTIDRHGAADLILRDVTAREEDVLCSVNAIAATKLAAA